MRRICATLIIVSVIMIRGCLTGYNCRIMAALVVHCYHTPRDHDVMVSTPARMVLMAIAGGARWQHEPVRISIYGRLCLPGFVINVTMSARSYHHHGQFGLSSRLNVGNVTSTLTPFAGTQYATTRKRGVTPAIHKVAVDALCLPPRHHTTRVQALLQLIITWSHHTWSRHRIP